MQRPATTTPRPPIVQKRGQLPRPAEPPALAPDDDNPHPPEQAKNSLPAGDFLKSRLGTGPPEWL